MNSRYLLVFVTKEYCTCDRTRPRAKIKDSIMYICFEV